MNRTCVNSFCSPSDKKFSEFLSLSCSIWPAPWEIILWAGLTNYQHTGPTQMCIMSSVYVLCFYRIPERVSLIFLSLLELYSCFWNLSSMCWSLFYLIIFYIVMFCGYPLFSNKIRGVVPDGRMVGRDWKE